MRLLPDIPHRARIIAWFGVLHGALAALVVLSLPGRPWLLLAGEVGLVISLVIGARMIRATLAPMDMVRTGIDLLREGDYTARMAPVGVAELDALVDVYNEMADRLRAERVRLVEQDLFLERLVQSSPTGVVTLDLDGRIALVTPSAERLLALRAAQATGLVPDDLPLPARDALAGRASGETSLVTVRGRTLRVRRASFHDRGFQRGFFLIEELTDELRASEKAAHEQLVRVMAHEVGNSVGAVRSLLESWGRLEALLPAEEREDFATAVNVASTRLSNLHAFVQGIAAVVRLPPPDLRPCDVARLVDDVLTLMGPELGGRGVGLRWETGASVSVSLDVNQIEQVLLNVVRNAAEAAGRGGIVSVALDVKDRVAVLSVRDSGPGLSPEARALVFTPFYTTKSGGLGVGLTLTREILTQHAFTFSLDNHADGGAEFRLRFAGS